VTKRKCRKGKGLLGSPSTPEQTARDLKEIERRKAEVDALRELRGRMLLGAYVPPVRRFVPSKAHRRGYSVEGNDT
jgi:hypothetical protein